MLRQPDSIQTLFDFLVKSKTTGGRAPTLLLRGRTQPILGDCISCTLPGPSRRNNSQGKNPARREVLCGDSNPTPSTLGGRAPGCEARKGRIPPLLRAGPAARHPTTPNTGTPCHPCSRHMADAQAVLHSHADLPADVVRRIFARAADHYGAPLSVKDRYAVLGGT